MVFQSPPRIIRSRELHGNPQWRHTSNPLRGGGKPETPAPKGSSRRIWLSLRSAFLSRSTMAYLSASTGEDISRPLSITATLKNLATRGFSTLWSIYLHYPLFHSVKDGPFQRRFIRSSLTERQLIILGACLPSPLISIEAPLLALSSLAGVPIYVGPQEPWSPGGACC